MNWGDMRVLIRELVGDPERAGGTANRYSPKMLCDSINHAMRIHAKRTECTKNVATANIATGGVVDVVSLLALEVIDLTWNGTPVDRSNEMFERQRNPNYRASTGTAYLRWFADTGSKIQLIPATQLTPGTVSVLYLETPTKVTTSTPDNTDLDTRINDSEIEHLRFLAGAYLKKLAGDRNDSMLADSWVAQYLGLTGGDIAPTVRYQKQGGE